MRWVHPFRAVILIAGFASAAWSAPLHAATAAPVVLRLPPQPQADFAAARRVVEAFAARDPAQGCELWGLPVLHVAGQTRLRSWTPDEIEAPWSTCWVFFCDDDPTANWSHPCRYVFVAPDLSAVAVQDAIRPLAVEGPGAAATPNGMERLVPFVSSTARTPPALKGAGSTNPLLYGVAAPNDRALIISGGQTTNANADRFWRDCAFLYDTLVHKYGYSKENVVVLIADGTNPAIDHLNFNYVPPDSYWASTPLDFDDDGEGDVDGDATAASVSNAFSDLRSQLTAQDRLLVFLTDHGGPTAGGGEWDVELCLWNNERFRDRDLKALTEDLPCPVVFAMEQCYSGGFADDLDQPNRIFVSAAARDSVSRAEPYPFFYDQWCLDWIAALRGCFPSNHVPWADGAACNADYNGDGYVSFREAAVFADAHNTVDDTPQYQEVPDFLGSHSFLGRVPDGIPPADVLDRLAVADVPSPAVENAPVPFRLEARNAFGALLDPFPGTARFAIDTDDFVDPGWYAGTGSNDWEYPFNFMWCQVRVQTIYPAAQLGGARTLDHLEILTSVYPTDAENWTIRLRHAAQGAYPEGATWETAGWTVVVQTNFVAGNEDGWDRFDFAAPFEYNGIDNLMVDLSFDNPTNYPRWGDSRAGAAEAICTLIGEADDGAFGPPLAWSATNGPGIVRTNAFVVLRCGPPVYPTEVAVAPAEATDFRGGVWTGDLTFQGTSKRLRLQAAVDSNLCWSAATPDFAVRDYPFQLVAAQRTPAGAPVLTWISGTGQTYRILSCTNLLAGFDSLAAHLTNSAPLNVYSGAPDSRPAVFYHVVEE